MPNTTPETETWKAERLDGEWCVRTDGERGWEIVARGLTEERAKLIAAVPDMHRALRDLLTFDRVERPAFRLKPEGAPGSDVRIRQEKLIALEDAALAALARTEKLD